MIIAKAKRILKSSLENMLCMISIHQKEPRGKQNRSILNQYISNHYKIIIKESRVKAWSIPCPLTKLNIPVQAKHASVTRHKTIGTGRPEEGTQPHASIWTQCAPQALWFRFPARRNTGKGGFSAIWIAHTKQPCCAVWTVVVTRWAGRKSSSQRPQHGDPGQRELGWEAPGLCGQLRALPGPPWGSGGSLHHDSLSCPPCFMSFPKAHCS